MAKEQIANVEDDAVQDDAVLEGQEDADNEVSDDAVEDEEVLDDEASEEEELEEEGEEDEIEPQLMELARLSGMTREQAEARGRVGILAHLEAVAQLRTSKKDEPEEEDQFVLKLSPEDLENLPPALVKEIDRIAKASKQGIKAAKEEVAPLQEQVRQLTAHIQREREGKAFEVFVEWCNGQEGALGTTDKPKEKARTKLFEAAKKVARGAPDLSVEDVCEIAYKKVFKEKPKQKARKELQKAAEASKKHSASAVGRATTTKKSGSVNGSRQASIESVRKLMQGAGMT